MRFSKRLSFMPVLLALAIGASAQNVVQPPTDTPANDCPHLPGRMLWPQPSEPGTITLHRRQPEQVERDRDDASTLEIWQPLEAVQNVRLAVCFGTIHIQRSARNGQMHLLVELPHELPRGQTVGKFVQTLQWTGQNGSIFLKVPEDYKATITLDVPDEIAVETDLGKGEIEVSSFEGNIEARVARGRMVVVPDIDRSYKSVRAAFASGGVQINKNGNSGRIEKTFSWQHKGGGRSLLTANFGSGVLEMRVGEFKE